MFCTVSVSSAPRFCPNTRTRTLSDHAQSTFLTRLAGAGAPRTQHLALVNRVWWNAVCFVNSLSLSDCLQSLTVDRSVPLFGVFYSFIPSTSTNLRNIPSYSVSFIFLRSDCLPEKSIKTPRELNWLYSLWNFSTVFLSGEWQWAEFTILFFGHWLKSSSCIK